MKNYFLILFLLLSLSVCFAEEQSDYVNIEFFYGKGCPHCEKLSLFLDELPSEYGKQVHIKKIDVTKDTQYFIDIQELHEVPYEQLGSVPKVFINGFYCIGDAPCIEKIPAKVDEELKKINITEDKNIVLTIKEEPKDKNAIAPAQTENKEINLINLLGLAAVDAVNPCEIAVLLILMTVILSRNPDDKKKALLSGLAFSFAVFLMYFVFGLLIIYGFKYLIDATNLSGLWFFQLLGIVAIIMGLLNLKDAIWYGKGGFVIEVPMSWRPKMKEIINNVTSVKGAFIAGLIVSFFLTPCTAGPYFVAGGILSQFSLLEALVPLLLYLIVFISPMLVISFIAYSGYIALEYMHEWREKNIKLLHWIAGIVLILLGLAMLLNLL